MLSKYSYILNQPWFDGKAIPKHILTGVVGRTARRMKELVPRCSVEKPTVFCVMDCSGVGKTSTVVDAANMCGFLHLHIVLHLFKGIIGVSKRTSEMFGARDRMRRSMVLRGFSEMFEPQLVPLFDACRAAIITSDSSCDSRTVKPLENGSVLSKDVSEAWSSLRRLITERKIPGVVLHVDEVQAIFSDLDYPEIEDLRGSRDDAFAPGDGHRLVLNALVLSLVAYIVGEDRFLWAFTGLRPNLTVCLNVPTVLEVLDLTAYVKYFTVDDVFEVFKMYSAQPLDDSLKKDDRMGSCLRRLSGPPRVMQCFFEALSAEKVANLEDMYSKWSRIEDYIEKRVKANLIGLEKVPPEDLRLCYFAPLANSICAEKEKLASCALKDTNRFSSLVQGGLLRLAPANSPMLFEEAYYFLVRIMSEHMRIPIFVVRALANLVANLQTTPNLLDLGKALEIDFVASFAEPRSEKVTEWLKKKLHVTECLGMSSDIQTSKGMDYSVGDFTAIQNSWDLSSNKSGADLLFDATLCCDLAERRTAEGQLASQGQKPEGVCVAVQMTMIKDLRKDKSGGMDGHGNARPKVNKITHDVCRMAKCAVDLFKTTGKRTVILFGAPCLPELDDLELKELYLGLSRASLPRKSPEGRTYARVTLNQPLPRDRDAVREDGKVEPPFAVFYVPRQKTSLLSHSDVQIVAGSEGQVVPGDEADVWKQLIIPVEDINANNTGAMLKCLRDRFLPNSEDLYRIPKHGGRDCMPLSPVFRAKRRASDIEEVFAALDSERGVSEDATRAFKLLCTRDEAGRSPYNVGTFGLMHHTDLEELGVERGEAKLLLNFVKETFEGTRLLPTLL